MAYKLFTEEQARSIGMQIVNGYLIQHDLPVLGKGILEPIAPDRQANKARQADYRILHSRLTIWKNGDNDAIVTAFQAKLAVLVAAKKQYRYQLGVLHAHQRQLLSTSNRAVTEAWTLADKAARMALIQTRIDSTNTIVADKLTAFNAAKVL